MQETISQPYKAVGKIVVLYIVVLGILEADGMITGCDRDMIDTCCKCVALGSSSVGMYCIKIVLI
jgi:hypothetical protein